MNNQYQITGEIKMKKNSILKVLLLAMAMFMANCGKDNNPVGPEEPDHAEAVGCVIKQGDAELVRAEQGSVTGAFSVEERVESPLLNFYLVAEDGVLFRPEEEGYVFAWESKRPDLADVIQRETDGLWGFHVKGFEAGQTSLVFKVLHGDHDDFVSLDIPIQITEGAGGGLGK